MDCRVKPGNDGGGGQVIAIMESVHWHSARLQTTGGEMIESCAGMHFTVSNLRERPEFFLTVADRIWDFSWKSEGVSLEHVSAGLREIIANESFPFGIVAHDGQRYLGSALGIASDLAERPQYTPWVAAVWVEPQYRGANVGRSLVSCAAQACLKQGFQRIYLCARAARHDFYVRQGWVAIEKDVGEKRLTVFRKAGPVIPPPVVDR
jgi:GNAT superfamily N-acetyltransferase